jgi:hypothetical protein
MRCYYINREEIVLQAGKVSHTRNFASHPTNFQGLAAGIARDKPNFLSLHFDKYQNNSNNVVIEMIDD